jgi:hypothetical protein
MALDQGREGSLVTVEEELPQKLTIAPLRQWRSASQLAELPDSGAQWCLGHGLISRN